MFTAIEAAHRAPKEDQESGGGKKGGPVIAGIPGGVMKGGGKLQRVPFFSPGPDRDDVTYFVLLPQERSNEEGA